MAFPSDEHSNSASAGTESDSGLSPAERNQPRAAPRVPRSASSLAPQNTADSAGESSPTLRRRRSSLPVFKETSRTPPPKAVSNIQSASAEIATPVHTPSNRSEEHTSELQSLAYLVCRL